MSKKIMIIGFDDKAKAIAALIQNRPQLNMEVVDFWEYNPVDKGSYTINEISFDLPNELTLMKIDIVIFATDTNCSDIFGYDIIPPSIKRYEIKDFYKKVLKEEYNEKKKITHVSRYASPYVGGIESVIDQINSGLPEERFDKEVICCSNTDKSSIDNGVKFTRCKFLFEFAANTISPSFLLQLSKVKTDILHYHMPFIFAVICHFIARPKYKKLYISYHGDIIGYDRYMKYFMGMYKYFFKKADVIHVLSPRAIELDNKLQMNRDKCRIVPFGVELENLCSEEEVLNCKKNYGDKKIIFCIGRFVHLKGFIYAIEAMKYVEGAILLLAGDGKLKEEYETYIRENNLQEKVKLLGFVTDKRQKELFYRICDIFILPSIRTEAFGIVQLEAMKQGKPVINTNLGTGANYVSVGNETGLSVEPKNPIELARAINKLLNDEKLRLRLGQNARKRVEELFDIKKVQELYNEMYN